MSLEDLKSQAERLADHLAQKHGVRLKHSSVLEALASVHGSKSWQHLRAEAQRRPGLLRRAMSALSPVRQVSIVCTPRDYVFAADPRRITLGAMQDQKSLFTVADTWLRRHILVVGQEGYGARSILQDLCAQQVAAGGDLLVVDTVADHLLPRMLHYVALEAGRGGLRVQVPSGVLSACEAAHLELLSTEVGARDLRGVMPFNSQPCRHVEELLAGGTLQYVSVPCLSEQSSSVREARELLGNFFEALPEHRSLYRGDEQPLVLVVPNAHLVLDGRWAPAFRQLRAYGVALVAQVPSLSGIGDAALREALLSACDSRVYYKPLTSAAMDSAAQSIEPMAGPAPRRMTTGEYPEEGEPVDVRSLLSALGLGDALFVGNNFLQQMHTRVPVLLDSR